MAEDKPEGEMQQAVNDIAKKMADMSAVHYGALPFIMAYSAAGTVVQFHTVFWRNDIHKVICGSSCQKSMYNVTDNKHTANNPLLQPGVFMPEVSKVTEDIDLAHVCGRARLILLLAKLYVLLIKMVSVVPPRAGRYPVFHTIRRSENVTVEILSNNVVKRISGEDMNSWEGIYWLQIWTFRPLLWHTQRICLKN